MYDWGAHLIDNVLHFADSSINSVSGAFYRNPNADPKLNDDHGHIEIRFASGAVGRVVISTVDREPKNRYTIIGEDATLVDDWNWKGGALKIYSGGGSQEYDVDEIAYGTDKESAPSFYAQLAKHYVEHGPVMVTAKSAARVIRVLNAADQSQSRGGAPVSFDE
jgi:predicted dehydrogenase